VELEICIAKNSKKIILILLPYNAITDYANKFGNYYIGNVPTCGVVIIKFDELNTISLKKGSYN
jgi:phosphohistidine phosphatase